MVFYPAFGMGAILAFSLSVAFVGNLSSPLLLVAADKLVCDIDLEVSTWEDKTIPSRDVPVPDPNVLRYGVAHILTERFDLLSGAGNWMTSNKFVSYQLQETKPEVVSEAPNDDPGIHRSLWSRAHWMADVRPYVFDWHWFNPFGNNFCFEMMPWCLNRPPKQSSGRQHQEAEVVSEGPSDDPDIQRSLRHPTKKDRKFPGTMPMSCWRSDDCRSAWMRLQYTGIKMISGIDIGFCNLCPDEDDSMPVWYRKFKRKKEIENANKWRAKNGKPPLPYNRRKLTLDHFIEGFTDSNITLTSSESHKNFEQEVCSELAKLNKDFPTFETSGDCKITFNCHAVEDEEGEEVDDLESEDDLVIVDNRDPENHNRGLFSSVTKLAMEQQQNEGDDNPPLYSVTIAS